MQRTPQLSFMGEADGARLFADNPHQGIGDFRQPQGRTVAHAEFDGKVGALADRQYAADASNAAHGDVEASIVHAAFLVEYRLNQGGVDVGHEFGETLDVVG